MAYQRPQQGGGGGRGQSGGYSRGAGGGSRGAAPAPAAGGQSGGDGGESKGGKGNKPAFRLALTEQVDGKTRTVKGDDGKTFYVGAAWENKFGGFNVRIEEDIKAGDTIRMYPVEEKPQS